MKHTVKYEGRKFIPSKGTLVALLLVSMLNCMGGAAVAPALPQISAAFPEASEAIIALIISLPSLAVAISGLFLGMVADKVGKAKTLVASLALFTLAGLSGIFLPTLETILVSRFVMGIGMAGVATASTALIADYYDADRQAHVMGMQSAATGLSVLVLEMSGGFLALLGWRVPFYVYAIGIAMIVCVCLFVREPYRDDVDEGAGETPEDAANATAALDTAAQKRPAKVEGATTVLVMCIVLAFLNTTVGFLIPSKMPYLVESFGGTAVMSGLFLGAFGLANIISSLLYARLVRRFGRFLLLGAGYALMAIGVLFLGLADNVWMILPGVAITNLGSGCVLPLLANWLAWIATPRTSGRYMGAFSAAINLGQFFSPIWTSFLLAQSESYGIIFIAGAILSAVLAVFCFIARIVAPGLQNVQAS